MDADALSVLPLKPQWKPPWPYNNCISKSAKPTSCEKCKSLLPIQLASNSDCPMNGWSLQQVYSVIPWSLSKVRPVQVLSPSEVSSLLSQYKLLVSLLKKKNQTMCLFMLARHRTCTEARRWILGGWIVFLLLCGCWGSNRLWGLAATLLSHFPCPLSIFLMPLISLIIPSLFIALNIRTFCLHVSQIFLLIFTINLAKKC